MDRAIQVNHLTAQDSWDIAIIGGGATGLGIAVDAATRGYKTVLFEAYDFAKGTSSRSTKLVHGGVRYLAQGDVGLVYEALKERGFLAKNAAHLVSTQPFLIPNYSTFDGYYYAAGLKVYNWMSLSLSLGKSSMLSKNETISKLPTVNTENLKGSVVYYDGQFDDSRLAINLAQTAVENGATLINYCKVTKLIKGAKKGKLKGVEVTDTISGETHTVKAKAVINAAGVFLDDIMAMDNAQSKKSIIPSQGVHLVLDQSFLPTDHALMVPKTSDGRVLFAVPWYDKLVVGTTDTLVKEAALEPQALEDEINFILDNFNAYITKKASRKDVLSVFAGLRPLAAPEDDSKSTKEVSRSHKILVSDSGLVTITGGKWTTYRKVAEDAIDKVIRAHKLKDRDCKTEDLAIHGNIVKGSINPNHPLYRYGSDIINIEHLQYKHSRLKSKLHPKYEYTLAEVVWAIEYEMAMTVEDILARRIRLLFLDAKAAIECAPKVAKFLAKYYKYDKQWEAQEVDRFNAVAKQYVLA